MLRNVFGGCVSDRSAETMRQHKIKFGAPLPITLKHGYIPDPLMDLLVYMAREGINTVDLFRRPGNPSDTRRVVKRLSEGKPVIFSNYSFYTLASVVKKFLLTIPGGVFGENGEEQLLQVLSVGHKMEQYDAISEFIHSLSLPHQQLLSLLFGIWFTMVHNSEKNYMSTEALSRSVAGSMFHTCAMDPAKVEKASRIMQLLIDNFGVARMFGQTNIEYFAKTTHTEIHVRETFRYQYQYPPEDVLPPVSEDIFNDINITQLHPPPRQHEQEGGASPGPDTPQVSTKVYLTPEGPYVDSQRMATSTVSVPEISLVPSPEVSKRPKSMEDSLNEVHTQTQTKSLSRYNSIKRKQLERLRQRSNWFLGPNYSPVVTVRTPTEPEPIRKNEHSGNSVTKASSEGAVLDVFSDTDSVFTDHTSRSESPASEPVRTNSSSTRVQRDIIHSDTLGDVSPKETDEDGPSTDLPDEQMTETDVCYFTVEHKYGEPKSS
ncbi:hypothetical protein CHS0354_011428 [Potamilus streckersoni]|uniref:Rho-GAP domain-containing protein n=1 Tax=Potamilus streckersoni TaxID=2493646 RepID=A0AAE0SKQ3_9BIVA|nr:hypothetical protein CHS0354_011428 [Potamilus streckersoni]